MSEDKIHDCPYCECEPESEFVAGLVGCLQDFIVTLLVLSIIVAIGISLLP